MQIVNVRVARSIWLVDTRDLNPRGISIYPALSAIRDRYRFQKFPKTAEEASPYNAQGIVFGDGSFAMGKQQHTIVTATMFGDGFVVDTGLSTDFSDAFLEDLLIFVSNQFVFTYRPEMIHKKTYVSELIVRTEKDLHRVFASLASVGEKLSSTLGEPFEPAGLEFSMDQKNSPRPAPFKFERELNKPFDQHRYYSLAPLQTSQHEELLRQLEAAL